MAKRKKNGSNVPDNLPAITRVRYPAVSVIIPLYNAEKYIAECLDSILNQTFQDFEIIVVDDCSTDSSAAIVESYAEKFGDKLTFTRLQKNSGNAGYTARNRGFGFSRGEYVFFVDADDFITKTALEELYTSAKEFDADVVYTGARYRYTAERGKILTFDRIGRELRANGLEDKPTLIVNDPHKYLQELLIKAKLYWTPWTKFVKRDFLTDNGITFHEILSGGDFIWTIELFASAKRFLRIPNAVYFWRDDSVISTTRKQRPIEKQINFWCSVILNMKNAVECLSNKIEFLRDNPVYIYRSLSLLFNENFNRIIRTRLQVKSEQIFEILRREFEKREDFDLIIPFMFSVIDSQQKNLIQMQHQFQKFATQSQARIAQLETQLKSSQQRVAELETQLKTK